MVQYSINTGVCTINTKLGPAHSENWIMYSDATLYLLSVSYIYMGPVWCLVLHAVSYSGLVNLVD